MKVLSGGCHCKRVSFEVKLKPEQEEKVRIWKCNCSDCLMRGNVHFIVPNQNFSLVQGKEYLTLYEWGTKTAKRYFCRYCGILPYYVPRSNPDGIAVTVNCVNWTDSSVEKQVMEFNGQNWSESYKESDINEESK